MSNFEIFCKLCDDKDYYKRAVDAYEETDTIKLSQIIGKHGIPIPQQTTIEDASSIVRSTT